jgi:UDP-N-acetyl-D-glucosamine/UDP-N-acetyl-D-galactosamine dehydrogenase
MNIGIIGLGYVGLPLAVEFGNLYKTVGFDIDQSRINELQNGYDKTLELDHNHLQGSKNIEFTSNQELLNTCNIYIITVPTPIDKFKRPDLSALIKASEMIANYLDKGDIVIYESTVYPGATEEVCVPILEKNSGLKFNTGFFCGYSPERISPGDKDHTIKTIMKITSGSTPEIAKVVDDLYKKIITAGTYQASSIRVAEAAKVIENTQRDVNIALINELALIFNKLDIDTEEVLLAAGTKWNFLNFRPGLVGGHCIGVDPYYLTHKANEVGYHPEMILAGRRLNDQMGNYVADQVLKLMVKKKINIIDSKVLILGFSFKENCPDQRNTRVIDLIDKLKEYNCDVDCHDTIVDKDQVKREYGIELVDSLENETYDAIVLAVSHDKFKRMKAEDIRKLGRKNHIIYDIKYLLDASQVDGRL